AAVRARGARAERRAVPVATHRTPVTAAQALDLAEPKLHVQRIGLAGLPTTLERGIPPLPGRGKGFRCREQLVPGAELDPRPAVRLAPRALLEVDRLPAAVGDGLDSVLRQEGLQSLVRL